MLPMKQHIRLALIAACVTAAHAHSVTKDIPYATAHERQVLDVHAPEGAKDLRKELFAFVAEALKR